MNCSLQIQYRIIVDKKWTYEGSTPIVYFDQEKVRKKRRLLDDDDKSSSDESTKVMETESTLAARKRSEERVAALALAATIDRNADGFYSTEIDGEETLYVNNIPIVTVPKPFDDGESNSAIALEDSAQRAWKAKLQQWTTFSVVNDFRPMSQIPPQMHNLLSHTPDGRYYKPIIYVDNFWVLPSRRLEFNSSAESPASANHTIEFRPSSFWRTLMLTQWDVSLNTMGTGEGEQMKKIFIETNPILLAVTVVVSLLHLIFEYLAFSNDISFWKNTKDYKGLSLKTIALNCYFQTVIFLYLLDGDETSYTVLGPAGIGVAIEYWKLRKTMTIERVPEATSVFKSWKIHFKSSYDSKTRGYDESAMRYLFLAMVPCMIGYTIYSAMYEEHKGWYSFLIATQVRFIYLFGFVMMTPQIFVNYKMKSVTQLPWRTFVYKALNTFIDDLFAFIITMPTMHRLACFRDDIIFFILLYQRWIYKVDPTRTQHSDDNDAPPTAPAAVEDRKEDGCQVTAHHQADGDEETSEKKNSSAADESHHEVPTPPEPLQKNEVEQTSQKGGGEGGESGEKGAGDTSAPHVSKPETAKKRKGAKKVQ
jgi:hypothetical protein